MCKEIKIFTEKESWYCIVQSLSTSKIEKIINNCQGVKKAPLKESIVVRVLGQITRNPTLVSSQFDHFSI